MVAAGGFRGHLPCSFVFIFFFIIVVVFESGDVVFGMPAQAQNWQDAKPWYPDPASSSSSSSASSSSQSALRFSPELRMAPSPQSSGSSAGSLSRPPPPSPLPATPPPTSASHNTQDNRNDLNNYNNLNNDVGNTNNILDNRSKNLNNILNNHNNQNDNLDSHNNMNNNRDNRNNMNNIPNNNHNNLNDYNPDIHNQDNPKDVPVHPEDLSKDFDQDLNGPEEKWDHDPDLENSELPPTQIWPEKKIPTDLPKDEVNVSPAVMADDLNVDRFRGNLLGFPGEDGNEDLDLQELRLKGRNQEPFGSASEGSRYTPSPFKPLPLPQGSSSTEHAGDVDTQHHQNIPMPDDVPVNPHEILPWPDMLARDIDVDKPAPPEASPATPQHDPRLPDTSFPGWKNLILEELGEEEEEERETPADAEEGHRASPELEEWTSPFQDQEEEEENEVPDELVQQVVKAMNSPSFWRMSALEEEEEDEEGGGMWESSGDGQGEEEEEFMDYWALPEREAPWNSLLLTLIFESIDDPEDILLYEDEEMDQDEEEEAGKDQEEEEEGSRPIDTYEKEVSIWQVLTNFPFPMLLHHTDDTMDPFNDDYIYDDDDDGDYEEYYDEDYEDDYDEDDYDEDDYDDEEYEDYEDNDEEGSDELDDYFYSEDYDKCKDCTEDDGEATREIAVLSLPPMLT